MPGPSSFSNSSRRTAARSSANGSAPQLSELARWERVSRKLRLLFHDDGVLSQFEGYERPGGARLGRRTARATATSAGSIAFSSAEGDSPNNYKVSKQADVLMLFYLFSADELRELIARLGYAFDADTIPDDRLLPSPHERRLDAQPRRARVGARAVGPRPSWELFREALHSDVEDIQGGTTREGIHLGAMAGTVDLLQRCYTGLEVRGDVLWLDPKLPKELRRLDFSILYRGHLLDLHFEEQRVTVASRTSRAAPVSVKIGGKAHELQAGLSLELRADAVPPRRR